MKESTEQFELVKNIDRYLAILAKCYANEGEHQLQEIIVNSSYKIHPEWSYDNFDGGIYGHAIYLILPESIYLKNINIKSEIQSRIKNDLNKIHNIPYEFIEEVFFEMEVPEDKDWRKESGLLTTHNKVVSDPIANRIWENGFFRVFLSHITEVKKETSNLKNNLKKFGIDCFVAHEDIHPTREWQDEIENALHTMDCFVALLTKGFHESLWTDQEVGFAFGRGVQIIAVKLGLNPYGFIGKFQALSCTWDTAPLEIAKLLIKKETMVNAYIKAIENCNSYDLANELSKLLPYIDKITSLQIRKIIKAYNNNSQISDSYGFNGKKTESYGKGLIFHLERLSKISLRLSNLNKIIIKQ